MESLGLKTLTLIQHFGKLARFVGAILRSATTRPYRIARLANEVYDVGVLSIAIVCASGATVGAVIGLQGYYNLARFGAESGLGAVVGLSLIRELGPVLTGLLVTGRAGSAAAAEIASMVTTEQMDGLRMMSIDPVHFVVVPKAIAMLFAMPLLAALFIVFAILGGYAVGVGQLGLDGGTYFTSLEQSVDFWEDILGSFLKALLFGGLVGIIATYRGFFSEPTSRGVSAATTSTVVIGSVSILIADYVFTSLWGV